MENKSIIRFINKKLDDVIDDIHEAELKFETQPMSDEDYRDFCFACGEVYALQNVLEQMAFEDGLSYFDKKERIRRDGHYEED